MNAQTEHVRFISVDPGFETLCLVVGRIFIDHVKKTIDIYINTELSTLQKVYSIAETDLATKCKSVAEKLWVYDRKLFEFDSLGTRSTLVVMEEQYTQNKSRYVSSKLQELQALLYSTFKFHYKWEPILVNSKKYKMELGIARSNHRQNKKAAVEYASTITGHSFTFEENHYCDCINQLFYVISLYQRFNEYQYKFHM